MVNFAGNGVAERIYLRDLIRNNGEELNIIRNCQNGSFDVPRELLQRLVWIGSNCGLTNVSFI